MANGYTRKDSKRSVLGLRFPCGDEVSISQCEGGDADQIDITLPNGSELTVTRAGLRHLRDLLDDAVEEFPAPRGRPPKA